MVLFDMLIHYVFLQYPDYVDAYLRISAMAKSRNDFQLGIKLVLDQFLFDD